MAKDLTPSRQQPEEEKFVPLLCPKCGGIVGKIISGQVRLWCFKCHLKTVFTRVESDKLPDRAIYVVILPGDGYTPGVA